MTNKNKYEVSSIKKLPGSLVEIIGSIAEWEKHRPIAIKNLNDSVNIDGFRKGMVPESILISKVGEMPILEETAELAISEIFGEMIIDNKIDAIGHPNIQIMKLASGNPLEFKATIAYVPEITLPDYKKLSEKELQTAPKIEDVTEKDIEDAILRIRKQFVSHEKHDHEKMTKEEHDKVIMENLPEFNDDFVKSIGNFDNVGDFKAKIKVMIAENKVSEAKEKLRIKIADSIIEKTLADIPEIMIKSEIDRIEAQFRDDIEKMGVKFEDYIKHAKKTIEDIRKEWHPHAEKKAKLQLVLNEIAKKENLTVDPKDIEEEVNHIVEHYKDADRDRASVYAETVLMNEKVFRFLEKNNEPTK